DVAKNTNVAKTATEDRISMITQLISENNYISRKEIADKLNVSQKTIERLLAENTDLIKHEGPKNGGYWVIKK
ncbi:MAG: HTH domain-containing protein, partial [Bacteroidales bacterium]|nr:HTH domain-containing protein [Bacteroidales bacterium]